MVTIVVVGKNESKNIERCAHSIALMKNKIGIDTQTIYVDSASSDGSFDIATKFFDEVYQLSDSPWLCASAGRYIGTLKAKHEWVLFLDADMELLPNFVKYIPNRLKNRNDTIGIVGNYIHIFPDKRESVQTFEIGEKNDHANYFGGAILLKKNKLVDAGNWDPSLFSNEEIELYSRLCNGEKCVSYIDVPMIHHYTQNLGKFRSLLGVFFPSLGLGKKYYGFGQLMASVVTRKNLSQIIKLWPQPFLYWNSLVFSILFFGIGAAKIGLFFLVFGLMYVVLNTRASNLLLYLALLPQTIFGYRKYKKNFVPEIKKQVVLSNDDLNSN